MHNQKAYSRDSPISLASRIMDSVKAYWWRVGLELKLRQSSGDAFQDFFGRLMQARHGDDYVRVRPYGQRGDKGCDGYLASTGRVFQCYGAVNGDGSKVDYLINKMAEDFAKAKAHLSDVMKEWHLAHNLVDGLPIEAVQKLKSIETENPPVQCAFVAIEGMAATLLALDEAIIETFVGPAASSADEQNLQVSELRDLVASVLAAVGEAAPTLGEIKEVSATKLAHNALPQHWAQFIASGWQNAHHVSGYFDRHHDPLAGERIARQFRDRYAYLKSQSLGAAAIMAGLYEMIVGIGAVPVERTVAAQALLAHLFESCDILEDVPQAGAVK